MRRWCQPRKGRSVAVGTWAPKWLITDHGLEKPRRSLALIDLWPNFDNCCFTDNWYPIYFIPGTFCMSCMCCPKMGLPGCVIMDVGLQTTKGGNVAQPWFRVRD